MDDYISRDAVFDWFCESADIDGCVDLPKNNGSCKKGCRHCIDGQEIDEIPPADVVPVVRCKDCVHLEVLNSKQYYARCNWHGRLFPSFGKQDTRCWFCADGERREE